MDEWWRHLGERLGQELPTAASVHELIRACVRLAFAGLLGAGIGLERQWEGKAAGLRTHTIVTLGAALMALLPVQLGMGEEGLSRVIQGVVVGVGFLGGGAILKLSDEREIRGLTTAAGVWLTAAIGLAAGLGRYGLAFVATLLAWAVLSYLQRFESPPGGQA
jgi:putative Mg2+ transporter-C (MgtC) family protein